MMNYAPALPLVDPCTQDTRIAAANAAPENRDANLRDFLRLCDEYRGTLLDLARLTEHAAGLKSEILRLDATLRPVPVTP